MSITVERGFVSAVQSRRRSLVSYQDSRALYCQAAEIIRGRITSGEYQPGEHLPTERVLAAEFGIRVEVLRRAVALLRTEGLVDYGPPGYRNRVRPQPDREWLSLFPGAEVIARMPTPDEQEALDVPDGVPVFVMDDEVYPGDRYALRAGRAGDLPLPPPRTAETPRPSPASPRSARASRR